MSARIPRLDLDDLAPTLRTTLEPRVARLKYLGEFFRVMGHQPTALMGFIQFTEEAKAGLDKRIVETIALTAATALGNDYERNQHERLSIRLGFGRDWIVQVERLDPALLTDPIERTVQTYVLAALERTGHDCAAELEAVVDTLGAEAAVAVMMVLGRYATHALIVNTLGLTPPVPSIFEDGFDGSGSDSQSAAAE